MKFGEEYAVFNDPFPTNIPMLKQKIVDVMDNLNAQHIRDAFQNIRRRAFACVEAKGGHFNEDKMPQV